MEVMGRNMVMGLLYLMAGGLLKKSQVFTDWPGLKKGDLFQGRDLHKHH